jgi:hypothetical protein
MTSPTSQPKNNPFHLYSLSPHVTSVSTVGRGQPSLVSDYNLGCWPRPECREGTGRGLNYGYMTMATRGGTMEEGPTPYICTPNSPQFQQSAGATPL